MDETVNRVTLTGRLRDTPHVGYSAAGIPIARFVLDHRSRQVEAGQSREVRCRIGVIASGESLHAVVAGLAPNEPVRVDGFLARSDYRSAPTRLVLHAERVSRVTVQDTDMERGD